MTDYFARQRQLIGTTAEWAANDLVIGLGEFAIEIVGPLHNRLKLGDGINRYSALPYYDPGINQFVKLAGDTMTGPLETPGLTVTGPAAFTGAVNLGTLATVGEPPSLADADTTVPTTHWVQQQIGGVISGLHLKGTWNAATNDPTLQSGGAGTPPNVRGDFYLVAVAGTTTLDGISTWQAGNSCVFNGVTWQRVPQTLNYEQVIGGLGYVPVNKAGDTMTGALSIAGGLTVTGAAITGRTETVGTSDNTMASTKFVGDAIAARAFRLIGRLVPTAGQLTIDFVNLPADINDLMFEYDVTPAQNGKDFQLRFFNSAGAIDATGPYGFAVTGATHVQSVGQSAGALGSAGVAYGLGILMDYPTANKVVGNVSGVRGRGGINNIRDTARFKAIDYQTNYISNNGAEFIGLVGSGYRGVNGLITGLRFDFVPQTGGFAAGGSIALWGAP